MSFHTSLSAQPVIALTLVAAFGLFTSATSKAQLPPAKSNSTWGDFGFSGLPESFSTDEIALFEGLNAARGSWSFEAVTNDRESALSVKGILDVSGNPKGGMLPAWKLNWGWPQEDPKHVIQYMIMASPRETGFQWMLYRVGPLDVTPAGDRGVQLRPTMFEGKWDLESRSIVWTESDLPKRLEKKPDGDDTSRPKQSFKLVVESAGKLSIQGSEHAVLGQLLEAKALERLSEAPTEPKVLSGRHRFKSVAEISDDRIKPWLPPAAKDITVLSERGGHFARYKIAEADFMAFLDELWETQKETSAHKRPQMSGEGEPANMERMARLFKMTGWEPLEQAMTYYGPSKTNGAMTTYYYDRETETAFHDRGYW